MSEVNLLHNLIVSILIYRAFFLKKTMTELAIVLNTF
jgi:hypothetical protein